MRATAASMFRSRWRRVRSRAAAAVWRSTAPSSRLLVCAASMRGAKPRASFLSGGLLLPLGALARLGGAPNEILLELSLLLQLLGGNRRAIIGLGKALKRQRVAQLIACVVDP